MFAGGLELIPYRVALDVVALAGLFYCVLTAPHAKNSMALLATTGMVLATSGVTSRWPLTFPMAPVLVLQLIRRLRTSWRNSKLLLCFSFLFVLASVGLSVLFPPLQLPRPQAGGPYAVGAVDFFLPIDPAKSEGNSDDTCSLFNHTEVRARLLYPTNNTEYKRIPYLSPSTALEFLQESMRAAAPPELKAYDWLMHHWLLAELPAQRHASLLPPSEKEMFPLVVYSHGLMGSADLYSYQTVSLASQGMLVLMVNHYDGSAPVIDHQDGTRVTFDKEIVQLWIDGKKEEYKQERRLRTEWRALEVVAAADQILALNDKEGSPSFWTSDLSLQGRILQDKVFFMGHSFGGATALTAAYRRPDLLGQGGGVIAHEPVVDWLPDEARRSLLPLERLEGLESSHNFTASEYHVNSTSTTDEESTKQQSASIHELNLLVMFSQQWRLLAWGESHILEEMHQKGRLGPEGGVSDFAVVDEAFHNEFSDMCMLTPLWLARETGVTNKARSPLETAREIEERTWKFVSSVLEKQKAH